MWGGANPLYERVSTARWTPLGAVGVLTPCELQNIQLSADISSHGRGPVSMKFVASTAQPAANLAGCEPGGLTTFGPDVRVAVVGYGYWGSKHMRVLSSMPGVRVTIVDEDPERIAEARRNYPQAESALRLGDVLGRVDAVVVATPPAAHAPVALQALRQGRHALVEKPLATTIEDAQEMVDAAAANGVHLMAGHTFEYNAAVWKLKEIIDSGELGRVLYIDAARLSLGKYQRDCNVIWDLAPHDISIATFLLGVHLGMGQTACRAPPRRRGIPATGLREGRHPRIRARQLVGPVQGTAGHHRR